jgi:hypothetical protein
VLSGTPNKTPIYCKMTRILIFLHLLFICSQNHGIYLKCFSLALSCADDERGLQKVKIICYTWSSSNVNGFGLMYFQATGKYKYYKTVQIPLTYYNCLIIKNIS